MEFMVWSTSYFHRSIEVWIDKKGLIYIKGIDSWDIYPEVPFEKWTRRPIEMVLLWATSWLKGGPWIS